MGLCQFGMTTQLRDPSSYCVEDVFYNIISRTERGGLPWVWIGMFGYIWPSFVGCFTSGERKNTGHQNGCGLRSSECPRPVLRMGWVRGVFFEHRNSKSLNNVTTIQSSMVPLRQIEINITSFKSGLAIFDPNIVYAPHIRVKYRHVNDLKNSIPRSVCIVGNYIFWTEELRCASRQGQRFISCAVSTLAVASTWSRIQWATANILPGVKHLGLRPTSYLHLVHRVRIFGAIGCWGLPILSFQRDPLFMWILFWGTGTVCDKVVFPMLPPSSESTGAGS